MPQTFSVEQFSHGRHIDLAQARTGSSSFKQLGTKQAKIVEESEAVVTQLLQTVSGRASRPSHLRGSRDSSDNLLRLKYSTHYKRLLGN
jgi:hypothetical protein